MYRVDQLTLSSGEPSLCPGSTSQADPELWGALPMYWVDQLTLSSGSLAHVLGRPAGPLQELCLEALGFYQASLNKPSG